MVYGQIVDEWTDKQKDPFIEFVRGSTGVNSYVERGDDFGGTSMRFMQLSLRGRGIVRAGVLRSTVRIERGVSGGIVGAKIGPWKVESTV